MALNKLMAVEVHCTADPNLRRYVMVKEKRVYGKDESGWVVLKEANETVVICIPKGSKTLPFAQLAEQLLVTLDIAKDR